MDRKIKILVGAGVAAVALVGTAMAAALSYITSAGDETRWGVRIARRLGIEPAPFGAHYSSGQAMKILERAEFTGLIHIALMRLSDEDREEALANFNEHRQAKGRPPVTGSDLAELTENFRMALTLLSSNEQSEVLANFNALREAMGRDPVTKDDLAAPVTD